MVDLKKKTETSLKTCLLCSSDFVCQNFNRCYSMKNCTSPMWNSRKDTYPHQGGNCPKDPPPLWNSQTKNTV